MVYTYKHKNITWVDLESPTRQEIKDLVDKFSIDPVIADELMVPTARSRVDLHDDLIFLVLHFPRKVNGKEYEGELKKDLVEVDFVIGKDFIITTRYAAVEAILEFSKVFEAQSILEKSKIGKHAGFVFYYMIRNIYKTMYEEIQNMRDKIAEYEEEVFAGHERKMVQTLSKMNRVLLHFRESLIFHKEILSSFEEAGKKIFENEFQYYLRAIQGEYLKVQNALESSKDYLSEIRNTNDSLLSTKQSEVMRLIAIISFFTFPLMLVTGIFSMRAENMPIVGEPNDFFAILGLLVILAAFMYLFFKRKKWL